MFVCWFLHLLLLSSYTVSFLYAGISYLLLKSYLKRKEGGYVAVRDTYVRTLLACCLTAGAKCMPCDLILTGECAATAERCQKWLPVTLSPKLGVKLTQTNTKAAVASALLCPYQPARILRTTTMYSLLSLSCTYRSIHTQSSQSIITGTNDR